MKTEFFVNNRQQLKSRLENNQAVLIFANDMPSYPRYFLQNRNFFYFTGLDIPNAIYSAGKFNNKFKEKIFIEREIPSRVVWEGSKISPEAVKKQTEIKSVSFLDEFEGLVNNYLSQSQTCFVDSIKSNFKQPLNKQQLFVTNARKHYPNLKFKNFNRIAKTLRVKKTDWEVQQIKNAIDATAAGIESIFKKTKPGMYEYELEAMLNYEITRRGYRHLGFKSIIAGGKNAATLHYIDNNQKISDNSVVLLDVGAQCNYYSADISRTFPSGKSFTNRQRAIYEEVLQTQKEIVKMVKPGLYLTDLQKKTIELITESLFKLKLIKDKKEFKKYYMHNVSHFLGLDTHDIGNRNAKLEAGNVITVEPGIYVPEEKIGVRIEDDVLVTAEGNRNLSENIPKEIDEIEAMRNNR